MNHGAGGRIYAVNWNHRLLSQEEEKTLFTTRETVEVYGKKIERVIEEAAEIIIACNQRLVLKIAKKFYHFQDGIDFQDLLQEGNIGLLKAISRFDPSKGYRFSTYAYTWIWQEIREYQYTKKDGFAIPLSIAFLQKDQI